MAFRLGMIVKSGGGGGGGNIGFTLGLMRRSHAAAAISPPLDVSIKPPITPPPLLLPEFDTDLESSNKHFHNFGLGFPTFSFGASMELMAVPKKKVSPHKRGIRNGPKALKPTPVIIRCNGDRGKNGEQSN